MKRLLTISLAVVLTLGLNIGLLPVQSAMAQTTIYVNASNVADPLEDGSAAHPFDKIQEGINAASSGDTVEVAAGTYHEHVTIDTSLTLQGEDRDTTVVDGSGSGNVIYVTANYVTISGFTVTNGDHGINLIINWTIHHITIRDSMITSNSQQGIYAYHSGGYHLIEDSTISNNGERAFYGHQFGNSIIRNCEVFGNGWGLITAWGSNTLITNNEVHHNAHTGIWLDSMFYTTVEMNNVHNNGTGIGVGYVGKYNTIRGNIVRQNTLGLFMEGFRLPTKNMIYHNDVIENTRQARDRSGDNFWDDGYPSGGNYWSDYTGVDEYSGVNQDEPGSDGIGDTLYLIKALDYYDKIAKDNYPLMRPWGVITIDIDIKPGSDPNSINLKSKGVVPVAVLTTDDFDANTVDPGTVAFGPDEVAPVHYALEDVDDDGDIDLILHFRTQETGIAPGDIEATLSGQTYGGEDIEGTDTVNIVPKGK